ncbi:hypothetical protein V492_08149 [Pseudogymnoascus sp. VKM F-4246]|nr:hypothetical protein V492_08149 [Pseudogymnoascus sp. VKM F-4246]
MVQTTPAPPPATDHFLNPSPASTSSARNPVYCRHRCFDPPPDSLPGQARSPLHSSSDNPPPYPALPPPTPYTSPTSSTAEQTNCPHTVPAPPPPQPDPAS